jgi:hypothetical protein
MRWDNAIISDGTVIPLSRSTHLAFGALDERVITETLQCRQMAARANGSALFFPTAVATIEEQLPAGDILT